MTNAQHTPGPWNIVYKTHNAVGANIRSELGFLIAEILDNCKAWNDNAFLIAAAPDLLIACKAQHEAIDSLMARLIELDNEFMPSECGQPWEAIKLGNAAITKTKG